MNEEIVSEFYDFKKRERDSWKLIYYSLKDRSILIHEERNKRAMLKHIKQMGGEFPPEHLRKIVKGGKTTELKTTICL